MKCRTVCTICGGSFIACDARGNFERKDMRERARVGSVDTRGLMSPISSSASRTTHDICDKNLLSKAFDLEEKSPALFLLGFTPLSDLVSLVRLVVSLEPLVRLIWYGDLFIVISLLFLA